MKVFTTKRFDRDYAKLSSELKNRVDEKLKFLIVNPEHSSLQFKKMQGTKIWEMKLTKGYRITFDKTSDTYILRRVGTHDILRRP